jgi:hypothetical protein
MSKERRRKVEGRSKELFKEILKKTMLFHENIIIFLIAFWSWTLSSHETDSKVKTARNSQATPAGLPQHDNTPHSIYFFLILQ